MTDKRKVLSVLIDRVTIQPGRANPDARVVLEFKPLERARQGLTVARVEIGGGAHCLAQEAPRGH